MLCIFVSRSPMTAETAQGGKPPRPPFRSSFIKYPCTTTLHETNGHQTERVRRTHQSPSRGGGRQTPGARGSVTVQYCPAQVFSRVKFPVFFFRVDVYTLFRHYGRLCPRLKNVSMFVFFFFFFLSWFFRTAGGTEGALNFPNQDFSGKKMIRSS